MLFNYLLNTLRNFRKQKLFTFIHVIGLSLGLMGGVVIFLFVHHHLSTNTFYPDADRIYRVVLDMQIQDGSIENESGTSLPMAQALKDEYTKIEQVGFCRKFYMAPTLTVTDNQGGYNKFIEERGVAYADAQFIAMFGHQFIEGNPITAMVKPNQVVITRRQAQKCFGSEVALGQTISINNKADLIVSGIIEDFPINSDFEIDVWISLPTLTVIQPNYQSENFSWIGSNNWTFIKLAEESSPKVLDKQLPDFVVKYFGEDFTHWHFHLQPLNEMHFDTRYGGSIRKASLWLLSTVALLIVLVACINFVNLSTAQALSRSKEVGVRKALGSSRTQLFWQFIGETAFLVGISLGLILITISLILPTLNNWIGTTLSLQPLTQLPNAIYFALSILGLILVAGSYPAIILASFDPVRALQNKLSSSMAGGYQIRKLLVGFQFTVSQVFIIGAMVMLYQLNYFQKVDAGFRQEALLTVDLPKSSYSTLTSFRNQLQVYPEINQISFHHRPPMAAANDGGYVKFDNQDQWTSFLVRDRWADENYLETYDLKLLTGRNITMRDSATEFLVNEEFVRQLALASLDEVIGKSLLNGNSGIEGKIVGVVSDFHHSSLQNPIEPVIVYPYPILFRQAGIQVQTQDITSTLKIIKAVWEGTFPNEVFTYQFLEDSLAKLYEKERMMSRLALIFTVASIIICCLGLLGLVTYSINQRTKEVGLRKVLGASIKDILLLLSKDFLILILKLSKVNCSKRLCAVAA